MSSLEFSEWLEGRDRWYVMKYLEIDLNQLVRWKSFDEKITQKARQAMFSISKLKNSELIDLVDHRKIPKSFSYQRDWASFYGCKNVKDVHKKLIKAQLIQKGSEESSVGYFTERGYSFKHNLIQAYKASM